MPAKTIMVQGTGSDVGKSIVVAALCRLLKRKGFRVAPFKAQNMSNNSYVTAQGGEMGRAQAVQALASCIEPSVLMNPVLLKPDTDKTSQIIVMGKVFDSLSAKNYYRKKQILNKYVHQALDQLMQDYDVVVIEGAGSPVEINIKHNDIVNMSVAKAVSSPVILVGDIDKGGVFAQIVGTFELLDTEEKKLVKTFLVNKFRGDKGLFMPGLEWIEKKIQRKSLGVLPMIPDLDIQQEDAVVLDQYKQSRHQSSGYNNEKKLLVHVIRLPRISNFTDFDHLSREEDVTVNFIEIPERNIIPDLLIIPGTKSTIADLDFLKRKGFGNYIHRCLRAGTSVLGICGGYQMLGESIEDPYSMESNIKVTDGLQLLPIKTVFSKEKTTVQVKAVHPESRLPVTGYEIHMGQTQYLKQVESFFRISERDGKPAEGHDGLMIRAEDDHASGGYIFGTYIHGLFESDEFRRYFVNKVRALSGLPKRETHDNISQNNKYSVYDRLADEFEKNIDMNVLSEILGEPLTQKIRHCEEAQADEAIS